MSEQKALRLDMKLRNNRMVRAREALGYGSARSFAQAMDLDYQHLCMLESLTAQAIGASGQWTARAVSVAAALGQSPEYLWPEDVVGVRASSASLELSATEAAQLAAVTMGFLPGHDATENRHYARSLLLSADLSGRERDVITMRYEDDMGLEDIGRVLDVSRERVRQLETRALHKLRRVAEKEDRK